ncbi:Aldose 1-epimerase [Jannaschia seosinensis]|uniref:Aldose 1-epimerase n=1 Tax=Jannaschia seosinensis TaxID=313367 RepID=A0A0M7BAE7_9RHOB|nr:Aldose 1-epimerase [Jannaschia seosinensis]
MENIEDYPEHSDYMGATAGRVANRIGGAWFSFDGMEYPLNANFEGRHMLHGGARGTSDQVWQLLAHDDDMIAFGLALADGEMGFPGAMWIEAQFACLAPATLRVLYRATTDAPTPVNLAHHTYWRLDDTDDIARHVLTVDADRYVTVNDDMIPTGTAPVDGTPLDFRRGRALPGEGLLDHNLCLSDRRVELRDVARLRSEVSGVEMVLATTEPGLQVYDGAKLNTQVPGLGGRTYRAHAGVALEAQVWPDAVNRPDFPDSILRPGETYEQTTTFTFTKG